MNSLKIPEQFIIDNAGEIAEALYFYRKMKKLQPENFDRLMSILARVKD